ncbi:hypothetical protein OAX78_02335 [Planctomycetota bacterium]|nr:hypothetical protein [Planctomycetota bacterium]
MSPPLFTQDDAWTGGFYELAIEVGPRSDARLERLLHAVWNEPTLEGCYLDREREPDDQKKVAASLDRMAEQGHLRGIATLPNTMRVPCGTVAIREEDGSDWLDFYLPLGALSSLDSRVGGFPFEEGSDSRAWREPIDCWLAEVARRAFELVPFTLGLIGFEVSGRCYGKDVNESGVPDPREISYLHASEGALAVYATNRWHTGPA